MQKHAKKTRAVVAFQGRGSVPALTVFGRSGLTGVTTKKWVRSITYKEGGSITKNRESPGIKRKTNQNDPPPK